MYRYKIFKRKPDLKIVLRWKHLYFSQLVLFYLHLVFLYIAAIVSSTILERFNSVVTMIDYRVNDCGFKLMSEYSKWYYFVGVWAFVVYVLWNPRHITGVDLDNMILGVVKVFYFFIMLKLIPNNLVFRLSKNTNSQSI